MDEKKIAELFDLSKVFKSIKENGTPKEFDVNNPEYKEFMEEALDTFEKLNRNEDPDFAYECWRDDETTDRKE